MNERAANDSHDLSLLIAQAKAEKQTKTEALNKHCSVLVKERTAGTSVRIMVVALGRMGVHVSEETLRLWFVKRESPSSRKPKANPAKLVPKAQVPVTVPIHSPRPSKPNGPRVARPDI